MQSIFCWPFSASFVLILPSHSRLILPNSLFLSGFTRRNTCYLHSPFHFLDFVIRIVQMRNYNFEAPHYAFFSILLLLPPSSIHKFSSQPNSRTLYTKLYTHLKQWAKFHFRTFSVLSQNFEATISYIKCVCLSVCLSFQPYGTTRLPLDGFS